MIEKSSDNDLLEAFEIGKVGYDAFLNGKTSETGFPKYIEGSDKVSRAYAAKYPEISFPTSKDVAAIARDIIAQFEAVNGSEDYMLPKDTEHGKRFFPHPTMITALAITASSALPSTAQAAHAKTIQPKTTVKSEPDSGQEYSTAGSMASGSRKLSNAQSIHDSETLD